MPQVPRNGSMRRLRSLRTLMGQASSIWGVRDLPVPPPWLYMERILRVERMLMLLLILMMMLLLLKLLLLLLLLKLLMGVKLLLKLLMVIKLLLLAKLLLLKLFLLLLLKLLQGLVPDLGVNGRVSARTHARRGRLVIVWLRAACEVRLVGARCVRRYVRILWLLPHGARCQ
jgi:hypothetical protein